MSSPDTDVTIVGAGLSGLAAAAALEAAGAKVAVLEADDRVGGRLWSEAAGQGTIDRGGQWVGPRHHRVHALAQRLGVQTFPTHADGERLQHLNGRVERYAGFLPRLSWSERIRLGRCIAEIEMRRRRVRFSRRTGHNPVPLELVSVGSWLDGAAGHGPARRLVDGVVRSLFGVESAEVSLRHLLFYFDAHGGFIPLTSVRGGAQQDRFVGGAQQLPAALAARLSTPVMLNTPVRSVGQDAAGVTIRADRVSLRSRYAIIAVPPLVGAEIDFQPALPARCTALLRTLRMGRTTKFHIQYDHPFWREVGLSGESISDSGPISATFDDSSHDGKQPALIAFARGRHADQLAALPPEERTVQVHQALAHLFGPRAAQTLRTVETSWSNQPWARGAHVVFPPGSQTGALSHEPLGRIHWAGTETATQWHGYMEGALASAERVAAEVQHRLGATLDTFSPHRHNHAESNPFHPQKRGRSE